MNDVNIFRESVERIVRDTLAASDIIAAEDARLPTRLYNALHETGVLLMLAPEKDGGSGASLSEALAVLRIIGAAAAPGPWLETMLGQMILASTGVGAVSG